MDRGLAWWLPRQSGIGERSAYFSCGLPLPVPVPLCAKPGSSTAIPSTSARASPAMCIGCSSTAIYLCLCQPASCMASSSQQVSASGAQGGRMTAQAGQCCVRQRGSLHRGSLARLC